MHNTLTLANQAIDTVSILLGTAVIFAIPGLANTSLLAGEGSIIRKLRISSSITNCAEWIHRGCTEPYL